MPSGSKRSRTSCLMRTPKEARMPRASGCSDLSRLTVSRSSRVLAWKMMLVAGVRTSSVKSARGPLPKKMTSGLFIFAPERFVVFNFFVVVDGIEVALVVHAIKGVGLVFDVVDEEDAIKMVDFVKEGASEGIFGFDADGGAVFEHRLDFNFGGARNLAVNGGNGEAALEVGDDFAFGFDDFGVDEGGEGFVFLVVEVVTDDDNAAVEAELRRSHGGGEFVRVGFFPFEGSLAHFGDDF